MKNIKKYGWIIAFLVLLVTTGMVRMVLDNVVYLPVIISEATNTPIPSLSQTPTPTPTSTSTPTPTSTPKPSGVEIDDIVQSDQVNFPLEEYVVMHNYASSAITMTDWFIRDDGTNRYDFPAEFSIASGGTIRLWSKAGDDTTTDLYWGSEVEVWNDAQDCAYLRDDSEGENELIDVYCYEETANGTIVIIRNPSE